MLAELDQAETAAGASDVPCDKDALPVPERMRQLSGFVADARVTDAMSKDQREEE